MKLHLIVVLASITVSATYAQNVPMAYDIAEIMMQKHTLDTEGGQFTIFYRFSTLEGVVEGGTEDLDANLLGMEIDLERTSLVFNIENIRQTDLMSIRFPSAILSAENDKFTVLADGQARGYELSTQDESTNLIFILPENTTRVEIVGTRVVPEFSSGLLMLGTAAAVGIIGLGFWHRHR